MLGPVDLSAGPIVSAITDHSATPAAYNLAQLQGWADAAIHWTGVFGLRTSLIVSQMFHETGYLRFGNDVSADQFNFAGLGATGDGVAGMRYSDISQGVCAVCVHHMVYIYGDVANWPAAVRNYQTLDQRYREVLSAGYGGVVKVAGDYTNGRWAYTKTIPVGSLANGYAQAMVDGANALLARGGGIVAKPRIIVSAGHEHIGQITSDKGIDPSQLRTSTGALGREAEWTAPWADALVAKLTALGVDAIRTDAIYHADVYGTDADLLIIGHCDGTGTKRAQWCMAGAVISGGSSDTADAKARQFAALWSQMYPTITGIPSDGPLTNDMTYEYEGWYRTPNTPAVLVEHFILGNGGAWSNDLSPEAGAAADAQVIAKYFNLDGEAHFQDVERKDPVTGYKLIGGIRAFYEDLEHKLGAGDALMLIGRPLNDEHPIGDATVQDFERARLEWRKGQRPDRWDIVLGLVNAELLAARAKETAAV